MDENFTRAACEDVELAVRMLLHGEIGFVPTAIVTSSQTPHSGFMLESS